MTDIDLHIGRRLRRRRRIVGLTQEQLAAQIGVSFQQVQKYECAVNRLMPQRLWQLACALGVPISYFFEGLGDAPLARDIIRDFRSLETHQ